MRVRRALPPRAGFTLAEVAVTIVIAGITLVWLLQGLNGAKMTAAHTHNMKLANQLALMTLGEVEAGLYQDELDGYAFLEGSYAEYGYDEFVYEVRFGDDQFPDLQDDDFDRRSPWEDNWRRDEDEDEDEEEQPFEKVRIRVTTPQLRDYENQLTLERWMPWALVYGEEEEEDLGTSSAGGVGDSGGSTR